MDQSISKMKKKAEIDHNMSEKKKAKMDSTTKKKAVLIGLKHPDPEMNDIDVKKLILRMKDVLIKHCGFSEDNITLMIEDEQDKDHKNQPTELNIREKLIELFNHADPGDIFFIHLIAYGCSDGAIIASDKDHVPDSFFRALIWNIGRQLDCDVTFVSDCLIAPGECNCPPIEDIPLTYEQMRRSFDNLKPENYHLFPLIDFRMWVPTNLSSVDILNEDDKKTTQHDDDDSSRIVLLTRFQRDLNATTTTQEEEEEEEEEVDPFHQNAATDQEKEEVEEEEVPFDQNATNKEKMEEEEEVEEEEVPFDQNSTNQENMEEEEEVEEEVEEEEDPFDQNATNQEKVEEEEQVEEEEDPFDQNATNQDKVEEEEQVEEEENPFDQNATNQEEEEEEEAEEEDGFEPESFSCLSKKEKDHYLRTGSILIMVSDSEEENQLASGKGSFTTDQSYVSELFFPPPNGTTTSPQHTLYGGFTNAILDVIDETHGQVSNLVLAQKAMEKLGAIPGLCCNHHQHANASFVC